MDKNTALIIGCGGVGSHIAYYLTKEPENKLQTIILIDGDKIERKNLTRQLYTENNINENKAQALAAQLKQFNPNKTYISIPKNIETQQEIKDLIQTYGIQTIFATTDNAKSKQLINELPIYKIIIGCDKNEVQITYNQKQVWTLGNGYNTTQDAESNIWAATIAYTLFKRREQANMKINIPMTIEEMKANRLGNEEEQQEEEEDYEYNNPNNHD